MADEAIGQPAEVAAPEVAVEAPAETPVETPAAESTLAATPETTVSTPEAPAKAPDWPDDWREKAAAHTVGKAEGPEYEKEVKRLQRIISPAEMYKSYRNLEAKLAKAPAAPKEFPVDGTDAEKEAWRKERGVPVTPADYFKAAELDSGIVIGAEDRPQIEGFLAEMHAVNADPKAVKTAITAYYNMRDQAIRQQQEADERDRNASRDALRDEMGKDYQRYLGAVQNMLSDAPDDVRQNLLGARLANGVALGNDPGTIRWLTKLAVELNPSATVVPGGGANSAQTIDGEIAAIETRMKTDRAGYFNDAAAQRRYDELLNAREMMRKKAS